jgi:hypothetical protein
MDKISRIRSSIEPLVSLTDEELTGLTDALEGTMYQTKKFQWEVSLKIGWHL